MQSQFTAAAVAAALARINRTWLDRRPEDLIPWFHPDITMVFPGFAGRAQGREAIVAGFADFCMNATVSDYHATDHQVDVIGDTAVASFAYAMVYERSGAEPRHGPGSVGLLSAGSRVDRRLAHDARHG